MHTHTHTYIHTQHLRGRKEGLFPGTCPHPLIVLNTLTLSSERVAKNRVGYGFIETHEVCVDRPRPARRVWGVEVTSGCMV